MFNRLNQLRLDAYLGIGETVAGASADLEGLNHLHSTSKLLIGALLVGSALVVDGVRRVDNALDIAVVMSQTELLAGSNSQPNAGAHIAQGVAEHIVTELDSNS